MCLRVSAQRSTVALRADAAMAVRLRGVVAGRASVRRWRRADVVDRMASARPRDAAAPPRLGQAAEDANGAASQNELLCLLHRWSSFVVSVGVTPRKPRAMAAPPAR